MPQARADQSGERAAVSLQGRSLDHFRVGARLGQGATGTVYEARDESLGRDVALKVLRSDMLDRPRHAERFLREARVQARLNHPNIVPIYYIGQRTEQPSGGLYFAMGLIRGESLAARVDRGERIDPEHGRRLMIQVADGLRAASRAGIIHRDVKPSNLILDEDGNVQIVDFGLAKPLTTDEDVAITADGAVVGSPLYMSPEQGRGENVDQRADMYSLGATFYHLLAGRPPFEGLTGLAVAAQHITDDPVPLRRVAPNVPEKLARIVDRLLRKNPRKRFDDYDALIEALRAAAPGRPEYAGFWTRGAAIGIDSLIAGILIALIGWPGLVLHLVYLTLVHAYLGQTLGKYLLRIRVHLRDGSRLGLFRSVARTVTALWAPAIVCALMFYTHGGPALGDAIEELQPQQAERMRDVLTAVIISNIAIATLFFAGLLMAAFVPRKRAIHDLLVGSYVTYNLRR